MRKQFSARACAHLHSFTRPFVMHVGKKYDVGIGMHGNMVDFFLKKVNLTGSKWSSLNAPGSGTPGSHPLLESSFFNFQPLLLPPFLSVWVIMGGGMVKRWKFFGTNHFNRLQMV